MKYVTMYQIYDSAGNKVYEPYFRHESAMYMIEYSGLKDATIVEVEIELEEFKTNIKKRGKIWK